MIRALVLCGLVGLVGPLGAQTPVQPSANMVTNFKGTLKGFQRGILIVTKDDDSEVYVQPPEDISAFNFVATAKPAFLRPGTMIRFSGDFNAAGIQQSPVPRVEVFQPLARGQIKGNLRERYVPGIYSRHRPQPGVPIPAVATYQVVGNLTGLAPNGLMAIQAGSRRLRVQLSEDAKFELRFNNLSLAKEGDPVTVAGFYQPPDETKVRAERITITTDRVYGEPEEAVKKVDRNAEGDKGNNAEGEKAEGEKPAGDQPEEGENALEPKE